MRSALFTRFAALLATFAVLQGSHAQPPLDFDGIKGTLIAVGGGSLPEEVGEIIKRRLGDDGQAFVLGDASEEPDKAAASGIEWLGEHGITNAASVPATNDAERVARIVAAIDAAQAVWLSGGQQSRLKELDADGTIEAALLRLLARDGLIAGTSAGAAIQSKVMIAGGHSEPEMKTGWDLLPGAIIDQHFTERGRIDRSRKAVEMNPGCFGLGIDEATAVIVRGRRLAVAGQGSATVLLAGCRYREAETIALASGSTADLTQLRRAARQRATGVDPGLPQSGTPQVPNGSLVIVGGGGMPDDVVHRFVELAGGSDSKIVVLPTAVPRGEEDRDEPRFLRNAGAGTVTVLAQRGPDEVASDEFQQALKQATGIWFGGGRQWNFVDAYEGTNAIELFHDVLRRGGVIGGSSAGATIQGEFLVRGHPLGNTVMMAEGYERGFAFLPGAAIDQHFSQRGRFPDLLPVVERHPQLLGIGIDESTAVVVRGSTAEVLGDHAAHFTTHGLLHKAFADTSIPTDPVAAAVAYRSVQSGDKIDLHSLSD